MRYLCFGFLMMGFSQTGDGFHSACYHSLSLPLHRQYQTNGVGNVGPWSLPVALSPHYGRQDQVVGSRRFSTFIIIDDNDDADNMDNDGEEDEDEEEEEEEDPYTRVAGSEFEDDEQNSASSLSTLSRSNVDWGGELGKLRQRQNDVDSGKSQDPSNALFRLMSAETPNQLIGNFVSTASPKVVRACTDAVNALLGGLSNPQMGVETIVKTNGERISSLCFQLQMTGYMFRNAEYVLALKEMMNIKGSATLQDYKDAFDRLDVDQSGFIEATEVKRLLDEVYEGSAPRFEVDAFLTFFDTNRDGKISWSEFETGLGAAMAQQEGKQGEISNLFQLPEANDDDDELAVLLEPEISGEVEIELDDGQIIEVEAKEYINSLKKEAEALKAALRREAMGPNTPKNEIVGASTQQSGEDFGGIAQYIASRQGDIKALTEGIQPEIVDTMKMLVDFVLEGGGGNSPRKDTPKEEIEMELPGSALQQLALWQLVLGYRLREAEATGGYLKLLE